MSLKPTSAAAPWNYPRRPSRLVTVLRFPALLAGLALSILNVGILDLLLGRFDETRPAIVGAQVGEQRDAARTKIGPEVVDGDLASSFYHCWTGLPFRLVAPVVTSDASVADRSRAVDRRGGILACLLGDENEQLCGQHNSSGQRAASHPQWPVCNGKTPMYSGMAVTALGTPLALGSYLALPLFASLIPVLIYRLIHEEEFLHHALPGYAEYCEQTRFRLAPFVW